jgi:hypothetical protein
MSRRPLGVLLALALAGLACATALAASSGPAAPPAPSLRPTLLFGPLAPLTVRGAGFQPRERVTVTLEGGRRGVRRVVANRLGRFVTTFEIALLPCRTVTVRAVGSRGSRALRQLPRPDCREQ